MTEATASAWAIQDLEPRRPELLAYCYRMLGSPLDAEDAVQETLTRAWRNFKRFEGRSQLRSWVYKIATNVCLDLLRSKERRVRPMDLGQAVAPVESNLNIPLDARWVEPLPDAAIASASDPADIAVERETVRLALIAALQELPPRQRAVLILREVLRWEASEGARLVDTTVASVNSALQRARATLDKVAPDATSPRPPLTDADRTLLERYVRAFERYDLTALTDLIREDATQSMPPSVWCGACAEDVFVGWL